MKPKEKAKELVYKFYPRATSYSLDRKNQNENAKQCALICVNEIQKELENERVFEMYEFWEEVKYEINKL